MNIKKILIPVDFPNPSLHVIHEAAKLARHFHSEILMMHVIRALSRTAGVPRHASSGWDMVAEIISHAEKNQDKSLGPELKNLSIHCILGEGDASWEILQTAHKEKADMIMMPSYGHTFDDFVLGCVSSKVIRGTECPVWTDAHVEESALRSVDIRQILCAVDFTIYNRKAVTWAAQMAAEFNARLTLVHVTPGVELWGPGGNYVDPEMKKEFVGYAFRHMAAFRQEMGIQADVLIGCGDVPMVLNQAVRQTKADLLVTACRPYGHHMRTHGYAIICAVQIPVLSM